MVGYQLIATDLILQPNIHLAAMAMPLYVVFIFHSILIDFARFLTYACGLRWRQVRGDPGAVRAHHASSVHPVTGSRPGRRSDETG